MNPHPTTGADADAWAALSAMTDGEAADAEFGRGLAAWSRDEPGVRQRWHAYQLIGDVLRSDDLAAAPGRDAVFLQRLQRQLDREPAVLSPRPLPQPAPRRRAAWVLPAGLAAGVMGLASVLAVSIWPAARQGGGAVLAAAPSAPAATLAAAEPSTVAAVGADEIVMPGGRVLRDAQLDRYLQAHRNYAAALPGSLPGGAGRSITTVSLDR